MNDATTPDLAIYYTVHIALRRAAHRLAATAATIETARSQHRRAFAKYWRGYKGEILAHHTIEDVVLFPALIERVPFAAALIARTDCEHHELDVLMARIDAAVAAVVAGAPIGELENTIRELASYMDRHLDFEDEEILPLFERHFTAEEYAEFDNQAKKQIKPGKQLAFTIAFVVAEMTPEQRATTLRDAPLAFRILYRLTRRSFARLEADVFGARPSNDSEPAVA